MILRKGIRNTNVKKLQQFLNNLGFFIAKSGTGSQGQETESFGPTTEKAVIEYQKSKKLKPDGLVGPKTWASLVNDINITKVIKPVVDVESDDDFSDPEEEMKIEVVKEIQPTCPNIEELINHINKSVITRNINKLVFHCTATQQSATVESILRYWKNNLGWKSPGYHIIVTPNGSWTLLQDFNKSTNGVAGMNSTTLHISYIGGINNKGKGLDNRTDKQKEIFETVYWSFKNKLPKLTFHGHNEFSNKACPSYNVKTWIQNLETKMLV